MPDKGFDPDVAGFPADDLAKLDESEPGDGERGAVSEPPAELTEPATSVSDEIVVDQPELFDPPPRAPGDAKRPALPGRPREVAARDEVLPDFAPPPPTPPAPTLPASAFSRSEPSGETPPGTPTYSPPPAIVPPPAVVNPPTPMYSPPPPPRRVVLGTPPATPPTRATPPPAPVTPPARPVTPFGSATTGVPTADAVTVVEVAAPDEGGVREAVLAADRSESPPSPPLAKRAGLGHPVARIAMYTIIVIVLTVVFLVLLINVFHLG